MDETEMPPRMGKNNDATNNNMIIDVHMPKCLKIVRSNDFRKNLNSQHVKRNTHSALNNPNNACHHSTLAIASVGEEVIKKIGVASNGKPQYL